MSKSAPKTADGRRGPPDSVEDLLAHPIRRVDNEPAGAIGPAILGCYDGWLVDHDEEARFFVGGFNRLRALIKRKDAKHFFSFTPEALKLAEQRGWHEDVSGLDKPASYNQFRKTVLREPMYFGLAVQVIIAAECAVEEAIADGRYSGTRFDVYDIMKIVPACFNVDGFNVRALSMLQQDIPNFDQDVLRASAQKSRHLLTLLAEGNCVTRRTARAFRARILTLLDGRDLDVEINDVRGHPGKKKLGRKNATETEIIELDDLSVHED
jgi:hypothetical protein